jgi:formate dehydrogenase subunit gamma
MGTRMIRRHSSAAIFFHWFNAVCWLFLLATGLGLVDNEKLQPLGMWWPRLLHSLFGARETLLLTHEVCGFIWAGVCLIYGVAMAKGETIPFLRQIFRFAVRDDARWLVRKGILMTMGAGVLRRLGQDPQLPDQGFYNIGQKLFAIPAVLGSVVIAVTGSIMALSKAFTGTGVVQWAILLHFVAVGIVFAGLLVHIFMASIAKGELPAFKSMFTGTVPEDFARHHNKLWYEEVMQKESNNA